MRRKPRKPATQRLRFILGFALGAILSAGLGYGFAPGARNGSYWNGLGSQTKSMYVEGYSDGLQVSAQKFAMLQKAGKALSWKGANTVLRHVLRHYDLSPRAQESAIHYLNQLYADPRYSDLDVGLATQLALQNPLTRRFNQPPSPPAR